MAKAIAATAVIVNISFFIADVFSGFEYIMTATCKPVVVLYLRSFSFNIFGGSWPCRSSSEFPSVLPSAVRNSISDLFFIFYFLIHYWLAIFIGSFECTQWQRLSELWSRRYGLFGVQFYQEYSQYLQHSFLHTNTQMSKYKHNARYYNYHKVHYS